jgi:hypothetical protein
MRRGWRLTYENSNWCDSNVATGSADWQEIIKLARIRMKMAAKFMLLCLQKKLRLGGGEAGVTC